MEKDKEKLIGEYVKNGGPLYSIDNISIIRDGGTIMLIRPPQSKLPPIYIHKDSYTLHSEYPTTNENLITDKLEQTYILDRLENYRRDCEYNLKQINRVIQNLKL